MRRRKKKTNDTSWWHWDGKQWQPPANWAFDGRVWRPPAAPHQGLALVTTSHP